MDVQELRNIALEAAADQKTMTDLTMGKSMTKDQFVLRRVCDRQAKLAIAWAGAVEALSLRIHQELFNEYKEFRDQFCPPSGKEQ